MVGFDRRRFLAATASAAALSSMTGAAMARDGQNDTATSRIEWEYNRPPSSLYEDVLRTDDGYLLVGGTDVPDQYETRGLATSLSADGDERWEQTYQSNPQREARGIEPQTGPIPEDWLTLSFETDDGYLLIGWTYFDGPAVYVTRIYDVDEDGTVRSEQSLGDLEDASAFSYLTDGVETADGFLCCGAESPGIMLGSAGWLVELERDGSVNGYTRYPATERDLETTSRADVFRAITRAPNGYVVAGSYEPEPNEPARGWIVGLDEDLNERWDERFALEEDEPTIVYDIVPSNVEGYDFVVVGTTGAIDRFGRSILTDPTAAGDGFVAGYTDDGERQWLEVLDGQPLFCALRTPSGVVAGGVRDGAGWVGTVDRTDFEADQPSVVSSLARGPGNEVVAAGRRIEGEQSAAWARTVSMDPRSQPKDPSNGDATEYLDCQRVRVVGDYTDVIVRITFDPGDGEVGTIIEPVGAVNGNRLIDSVAEFNLDLNDAVLTSVELFTSDEPAVPGLGEEQIANPNVDACFDDVLGHLDLDTGEQ
ncbi:hypothetical protein HALLA_20285 (plasmid) [Halostagnicola larsenii XH-48]|uniref:Uncharacterized protein n=1 Tax=Halostagnicola larsenii XH-48 TaxID=797299 RepID=W0JY94_9EURY|nr:hypothetical protein [Halostagnicola larsenii]AHG02242.1 hypothetical protein HALLA_20285 [Halostagnicola larsenii XH-48]